MSLLDELKQQAEQRQTDGGATAIQARREAFYQEHLRPRLHAILNYLGELTEQLKLVDPDVRHDYRLPGIGEALGLRQGGYIVHADSTDQTRQIRLRFHCLAEREQEYAVRPKAMAAETREFLETQRMRYAEWPIRDNEQRIVGINFQLRVKVEINFLFQALPEQGGIRMAVLNFYEFGAETSLVKPERITDQWLDNLGNYLLRRHQKLHNLEIEESDRETIRQKLIEERRARQQELELALQREKEEQEERRRNSLLGKLRGLAKR
jgi:hypothetical protein